MSDNWIDIEIERPNIIDNPIVLVVESDVVKVAYYIEYWRYIRSFGIFVDGLDERFSNVFYSIEDNSPINPQYWQPLPYPPAR